MHMVHLSGNTSVVSNSSSDWLNYTGFPGDECVTFFNVPPGNKWRFSTAWYGTVRYGSLLGGFPLGTVPGT